MTWIAVALGGAVGATSRYAISLAMARYSGFPWGTLIVNVVGCFLLGALTEYAKHAVIDPLYQRALGAGLLGALTTFSTFGNETIQLLEGGRPAAAMGNIALNLGLGLVAVWLGIRVAR